MRFLLICLAVLMIAVPCQADGLIGKRYVGFSGGVMMPKDLKFSFVGLPAKIEFDTGALFGVGMRYPIGGNTDFLFTAVQATNSGEAFLTDFPGFRYDYDETSQSISVGICRWLSYSDRPKTRYFLEAEIAHLSTDWEVKDIPIIGDIDGSETDTGYGVTAGIEYELGENSAITTRLGYVSAWEREDLFIGLDINHWFGDRFGMQLQALQGFEEVGTSVGLGFLFTW